MIEHDPLGGDVGKTMAVLGEVDGVIVGLLGGWLLSLGVGVGVGGVGEEESEVEVGLVGSLPVLAVDKLFEATCWAGVELLWGGLIGRDGRDRLREVVV